MTSPAINGTNPLPINRARASSPPPLQTESLVDPASPKDDYSRVQPSKFHLKLDSKTSSSSSSRKRKSTSRYSTNVENDPIDLDEEPSRRTSSHSRHHRSHRHRRKRRHSSPLKSPPPPPPEPFDADADFRASLFEAMADDEGAAFFESTYGQPLPAIPLSRPGPTGVLERMSDEEYAAHVRREMWRKSEEGRREEMEERRRERRVREENRGRREREEERERMRDEEFKREVEESLRRGRERRERVGREERWRVAWRQYESGWAALGASAGGSVESKSKSETQKPTAIPWPARTGKLEDVNKTEIEAFFTNSPAALRAAATESATRTSGDGTTSRRVRAEEEELARILKAERVRWHPDKAMQKLGIGIKSGASGVDDEVIKGVTAVFQIVDQLWREVVDGRKGE